MASNCGRDTVTLLVQDGGGALYLSLGWKLSPLMLGTYAWWTVMGLCRVMLAITRLLALTVMLCRVHLLARWHEIHTCRRFLCFQNRGTTLTVGLSTRVVGENVKGRICETTMASAHKSSSWSIHLCCVLDTNSAVLSQWPEDLAALSTQFPVCVSEELIQLKLVVSLS